MYRKLKLFGNFNRLSKFSILIIFISVVWIQFNFKNWEHPKSVIQWDVINYYQFLPAVFDYGDISFKFIEKDRSLLEWNYWPHVSPNGKLTNKMSMGLSFMYLPFYLIGQIQAYLTHQPTNGFSSPYIFWLVFSSLFYVIIGFVFLRKILLLYFSDAIVALTILSVFFGTNLLYYTTLNSAMPHAYLFSLFAIFIYYTIRWHESISFKNTLIIGLLIGLISLIRPSNMLIITFFGFYSIYSRKSFFDKIMLLLMNWKSLILIAVFAFIVWIPQLIYWKYSTGSFFYFSYRDEGFFFNNPQIIKGLFGYRKGWFTYTPLMLFAVLSIFLLLKKHKSFFLPILSFTVINIYLILSWWCWWYGGTYGQRSFVESYAILAIPFAALLSWSLNKKHIVKITAISFLVLLLTHQLFQTIKYNYLSVHYDSMTKEAYWDSFFNVRPSAKFASLLAYPDYETAVYDNDLDTKPNIIATKQVNIKAFNGKFISIDTLQNIILIANEEKSTIYNSFMLFKLDNGYNAFKAFNNKYFTAELESNTVLYANIEEMSAWEMFLLKKIDEKYYAIQAINGNYFTAGNNGKIYAHSKNIGEKEKFEIIYKN